MSNNKIVEGVAVSKVFTQKEVNNIMGKRLKREKHKFDREFEHRMLQIEVLGRLKNANIPTSFAQFIIVSKNQKRTRETLEQFTKIWAETQK